MKMRTLTCILFSSLICLSCISPSAFTQTTGHKSEAEKILKATGVKGGLVVHLGCSDGKLTAALHAGDSYLVHGLDTEAKNVRAAIDYIQ